MTTSSNSRRRGSQPVDDTTPCPSWCVLPSGHTVTSRHAAFAPVQCTSCSTGRVLNDPDLELRIGVAVVDDNWALAEVLRDQAASRTGEILAKDGWILREEDGSSAPACSDCVTLVKIERAQATCPPWCTTDHETEALAGEWTFQHRAPAFGALMVCRWNDGPLLVNVADLGDWQLDQEADRAGCIASLRDLAQDAAAVAEWIEVNS